MKNERFRQDIWDALMNDRRLNDVVHAIKAKFDQGLGSESRVDAVELMVSIVPQLQRLRKLLEGRKKDGSE